MPKKAAIDSKDHQEADHLFGMICQRLRTNVGMINENRLRQAFELALSAHEGQERMDGTPYIYHPLEVAEICVDLNMEEDSVIAALLHDTVEDTAVRQNQIRQLFGNDVANMVDNLTKIKKIDFFARFTGRNKASNQARNLQRLFVAMTRDTRVIVIKLADRLHNMKTLGPMPAHKRDRIARETLEFYIPIARRLGLGDLATKLEDLVFESLLPEQFEQLKRDVAAAVEIDEPIVDQMVAEVKRILAHAGLQVDRVFGRRKHLWSVFQKMQKQGVELDGVYDLLAIRIILNGDELDCYKALGVVHTHYKPIFHRFRDFIASPKENGYQTLHTTVIGKMGSRVECQIRTTEMDNAASKGVAAHWTYKESGRNANRLIKDEAWLEFIRELSEEDMDSDDFVARTRDTLLGDQVLVLSPKGEVVNLPVGSTPIDFAYYIHTDLGHSIRNAKINGLVVPLDYQLRNGDVVEVIKSDEKLPAPRPEWLMLAKSPKSLLKIRRYFRSLPRQERISVGRNLLRMQIVKEGLYPLNLTANEKLAELLRNLPVRSIDELYENVAMGTFHIKEIVDRLRSIHRARVEPHLHDLPGSRDRLAPGADRTAPPAEFALIGYAGDLGVRMAGGQPLRRRVEIMNCCTPVPGDKIYGVNDFEQRRVSVHRVECPVLQEEIPRGGELQELDWNDDHEDKRYPCRIMIVGINRVGLLFEVLRYLSNNNVNLGGGSFNVGPTVVGPDRNARFELVVEVADTNELNACLAAIGEMDDIFEVTRQIQLPNATGDGALS